MSRQTYPTQLRDPLGNEFCLPTKPFATGGEGAVFDVVGRNDLVAKLYSKAQTKERCDKLRAMASLCSPDLLKIAAWPISTLHIGSLAAVDGILMPRIADHKEIHHLYSVAQRKKDFPEADWGFLLHTARNCAIAFETIHGHGHVVGDVNQKNVMVSKKGIVALVDCDSFQVKEGNRIFRCGVGVPEYTPPELHGRKFTDLDRNANHDLFGLAVLVFHLLIMGRHPFVGVPQVPFDIPIEKAIQKGFYAYARIPNKLKPPPHVPPMAMLDTPILELFERAFGSAQRPTATEWRRVLDASMKGLQRCKNDPKHSYPAAAGNCPWCQLIAVDRLMFFIPIQHAAGAMRRFERILSLIQKLTGMSMALASYTRPVPILPVEVILRSDLRTIRKPIPQPHPAPPLLLPKAELLPSPLQPVLLARPVPTPRPAAPAVPIAPQLQPHPIASVDLPRPKLKTMPPPPIYPMVPTPAPIHPFLPGLCIAGILSAVPMSLVVWPVGVIMLIGFGAWLVLMKVTEGWWRTMAHENLKKEHEAECTQIREMYDEQVQPIRKANGKLLQAWEAAKATKAAKHYLKCKAIGDENHRMISLWEAEKAEIEADHRRAIQMVDEENDRVLSTCKVENTKRQATYDQARRETEVQNQGLISAWKEITASRQADYVQKCREIDVPNRQALAAWEAANAPWIDELNRWNGRVSIAESEIKRLERECVERRNASISKFQRRRLDAEGVLKSHEGVRQDFERELRQAEDNSKKTQLEEYLDNSLVRSAHLQGINSSRLHVLESFGIETAKDLSLLEDWKLPGIGFILSNRLLDWRNKLASSFRPKQGLAESEKNRIAARYASVLMPLEQAIQTAINDLEGIAVAHRNHEADLVKAIEVAVQDLAKAKAYVRVMEVV